MNSERAEKLTIIYFRQQYMGERGFVLAEMPEGQVCVISLN